MKFSEAEVFLQKKEYFTYRKFVNWLFVLNCSPILVNRFQNMVVLLKSKVYSPQDKIYTLKN